MVFITLVLTQVYLNSYKPNNYEVYNGNGYVYGILSNENETNVQNKIDKVINEAYNNSFIIEKDNTLNSQVNIEDKDSTYALDSKNKIMSEDRKITIYRVGKEAITLSIKDYLKGVLAAASGVNPFNCSNGWSAMPSPSTIIYFIFPLILQFESYF